MTEPSFGEIQSYDESINTPSKNPAYYKTFHAPVIEEAKNHTPDGKVTILGLACGSGNEFEFMRNDSYLRIIGFDIDPKLIQQARSRFVKTQAEFDFFVGDIRQSPFKKDIAHIAIAVNALIYN